MGNVVDGKIKKGHSQNYCAPFFLSECSMPLFLYHLSLKSPSALGNSPSVNSVFHVFLANYQLLSARDSVSLNRLHLIRSVITIPLQFRICPLNKSRYQHAHLVRRTETWMRPNSIPICSWTAVHI